MRTAFVFPGQGSLDGDPLGAWRDHDRAAALIDRVCEATDVDLWSLPADAGGRTAVAQPAIFAAGLASLAGLESAGARPDAVAGHSLGELTAAVAAGVLAPGDGAAVVAVRGTAFAAACERQPGTMAAVVRLDLAAVEEIVSAVDGATVANVNAPGQVVVSGTAGAIERVRELARERGGRGLPLDVEGAFHSPAMASAVAPVGAALDEVELRDPAVPLVSGTGGRVLTDGAEVRRALLDGILAPVEWVAVQRRLVSLGVERIVEVGPGGVLAGLARRTVPDRVEIAAVAGPEDLDLLAPAAPDPRTGRGSDRTIDPPDDTDPATEPATSGADR